MTSSGVQPMRRGQREKDVSRGVLVRLRRNGAPRVMVRPIDIRPEKLRDPEGITEKRFLVPPPEK